MPQIRPTRVAQQIQEEIAKILSRGLKDPRVGFVTVTGVKIGPDLKQATIYYSVIGESPTVHEDTQKGLESAAGFLRRELGQGLRHAPHLVFKFDPSVENGDRIERLLREAKASDSKTLADAEKDKS
jgi:ribosome-binding factor A